MAITPLSQAVMAGMDPNVYRPLADIQQGDAMLQAGMDSSPTSKWGAIGRLANALAGSYISNSSTSDLAKTIAGGKKSASDQLMAALEAQKSSIPSAPPAIASSNIQPNVPQAPVTPDPGSPNAQVAARFPAEMSPGSAASPLPNNAQSPLDTAQYPAGPVGGPSQAAATDPVAGINAALQPRGIRNNNPLNIEDGAFTKAQPGYVGSDGRFAKFQTPEHGVAAASALLDTYNQKHGLNTVAGIVGRWAPQSAGNNTMAYASDVASKLGIDPNAPIPPEMRQQLIAAMAQHENGVAAPGTATPPVQLASAAPTTANDAGPELPANAAPTGTQVAQNTTPDIHRLMAVMQNPYADEATKALASKLIIHQLTSEDTYGVTGESPFGGKKYGFINTRDHTINGQPADGSSKSNGALDNIDQSKTGEDYMKQFPPDVQAMAKAYMNGDIMPTGNPRQQGLQTLAKQVAVRYGQDMGIPVNDQEYGAKRKMQVDLASSSPNATGGILSNGKSAFAHLADASDRIASLGNYNGPDIPGGGQIATVGNYIGNKVLSTSDTNAKQTAVNDALLKYGQEATKFYAGSGGGEGERMAALKSNNAATSSGREQAAFLDTEKSLMLDRLHQKEIQIRGTLGQDYLDRHPVMTKDLTDNIKRIDANIARLRGEAPASGSSAAPVAAPSAPAPDRAAIEAEMRKRGLIQ